MTGLLDEAREAFEGKIPFQGQRLADRINQESLVLGAGVAFLAGYFTDSLFMCMSIFGAAFVGALIVCVPPWPMYRKYPVIWLPNLPSKAELEGSSKAK